MTAISGGNWMTPPTYDAAGNMLTGPYPGSENFTQTYAYDAWNHLSWATNSWGNSVEYRYDGLGRRIASIVPTTTGNPTMFIRTDYYYNESWQVLEERRQVFAYEDLGTDGTSGGARGTVAGPTYAQYIWDLRYIDAPVLRWRDADENSENGLEECLYYCNDANMNVTALVDGSTGAVVERYVYDAYGSVTFCNSAWSPTQVSGGYPDGTVSLYDNEILYCGYRFDPATGLYTVRHRTYHPTVGRWTTRDPGQGKFYTALYEYVGGRPNCLRDATGLDPEVPWYDDPAIIKGVKDIPGLDPTPCYAKCADRYYYCEGCKIATWGPHYTNIPLIGSFVSSYEYTGGKACRHGLTNCLARCKHDGVLMFPCCMSGCDEKRKPIEEVPSSQEVKGGVKETAATAATDAATDVATGGRVPGAGPVISGIGTAPAVFEISVKNTLREFVTQHPEFSMKNMHALYSNPDFVWVLIMAQEAAGQLDKAGAMIKKKASPL
jgi:RHS repeat-associated protein